jgi:branched-chain amino acid transport system permease protein
VQTRVFLLIAIVAAAAVFFAARAVSNDYVFFAGYTVLQFVVLATAWNILGGYTGYVNFGSAAFFALGAYSTVALHKFSPQVYGRWLDELPDAVASAMHAIADPVVQKLFPLPIPILIVVGGIISAIVGLGTGYLTLRLRGAFFAIATLALAVVLQTFIVNWDYVGGSRGAYIIRPNEVEVAQWLQPLWTTVKRLLPSSLTSAPPVSYIQYLFLLMLVLVVIAVTVARGIERSQLGYGFATIRDDELAAEASGVPTLKLKLIATTLSGALMGMAGAPFPYYIGYLQPSSAFGLEYAVNSIAMPMIGGTTSWAGPLIGAILLGSLQQYVTVTISSSVNVLIVGVLLIVFVIIAPNGIVGLVQGWLRRSRGRK